MPTGFVVGLVECVDRFDTPRLVKPRVLDIRIGNRSMLLSPEVIPLWRVQTLLPLMELPITEQMDLVLVLQAERGHSAHSSLAWCIRRELAAAERRDFRRSIMHVQLDGAGRGTSRQPYVTAQILAALTAAPIRRGVIRMTPRCETHKCLLPCPWPECPRGVASTTTVLNGVQHTRLCVRGEKHDVWFWMKGGKPKTIHQNEIVKIEEKP